MGSEPGPPVPVHIREARYVRWPIVIGLLALPLVVVLAMYVITTVQGLTRYDPQYFTDEYRERYASPGAVAIDLERALRDGDRELMAELIATRRSPRPIEPSPNLIFTILIGKEQEYFKYLYWNPDNYHRVPQYVTERRGRFVATETDLYYYWSSGTWKQAAAPLFAAWWILVGVTAAGIGVYRWTAAQREEIYGR